MVACMDSITPSLTEHVTYSVWCSMIDANETAGIVDALPKILRKPFEKLFSQMQSVMLKIAAETHTDWTIIAKAFASRSVYELLKAVAFSITKLYSAVKAFASVYEHGLLTVFNKIAATGAFQKLRSGVLKVDDLLNQYPILKKVAGPAVAGFLFWCFLHANFTWNPSLDMDFTPIFKAALNGHWSFEQLLLTPSALLALTTLFTSLAGITIMSPIWLATSNRAVMMALFYTGLKHLKNTKAGAAVAKRIYPMLQMQKL